MRNAGPHMTHPQPTHVFYVHVHAMASRPARREELRMPTSGFRAAGAFELFRLGFDVVQGICVFNTRF